MAYLLLACAAALLLMANLVQYRLRRKRSSQLQYISRKLSDMVAEDNRETLLLLTDDPELRALLVDINGLLEHKRKNAAAYARTEGSIKKMLANISHDLKTPLTVVLGYIETLANEPEMDSAERERLLTKVHVKAGELLNLMNRFFDLAKLESGDKDFILSRVQMNEICMNNMLAFYDMITAKGFEAVIDIPEAPVYAQGNEEALERILNNLISNAIRHGADGRTVGLTLRSDDHYVYIEVWDRGKGIREQHKELVFERMYTLEDSRNKLYEGSGLGLTITKRLVERLKGEVLLESRPYEKTVFTVKLNRIDF